MTTGFWKGTAALLAALCLAPAWATTLYVETGTRLPGDHMDLADEAVREYAKRMARYTERTRLQRAKSGVDPFQSMPVRVVLTRNGSPIPPKPPGRGRGPDLEPTFDLSGARAFPTAYRQYLESVFNSARPAMNGVFGEPNVGGVVRVRNYDADIQDRYAVAGGYYVPNGPDGPEIRFPIYQNEIAAAINYIHTLLLAYAGPAQYPFDAFSEGLVRAATIRIARTPGAVPNNPPTSQISSVLESTYDVSSFYDWYNQPGLGAPRFIAPNLIDAPLPAGGSTGGIFLLRYQMAGTAWLKVVTEHPGFLPEFNRRFYIAPAAYQTESALVTLAQLSLDVVTGSSNTTVEGSVFQQWFERQFILDSLNSAGLKVVLQPFPIPPTTGTDDFGVFGIIAHALIVNANGDEILPGGESYPLYWRPDFTRFFMSAQDDRIDLFGGFGAVAPNFPGSTFSNAPYRVAVDVPFRNEIARVYLPAGAIARAQQPQPNEFAGSLIGLDPNPVGSYSVNIEWVGGSRTGIGVQNLAFGASITETSFEPAQPVTIRVFRTQNGNVQELFSRRVNKGFGALYVDLRPESSNASYSFQRSAQLDTLGLPLQPWRSNINAVLDLPPAETLAGRWDATVGRFSLYPDRGHVSVGNGWFVRPPSGVFQTVEGRRDPATPVAVALQPGWNQVTVPFASSVDRSSLRVTVGEGVVSPYNEVAGSQVGTTIFGFNADPVDADTGTLVPVNTLQPGKSYYVRALDPRGAVLIFYPGDFGGSSALPWTPPGTYWAPRALGLPQFSNPGGHDPTEWNRWKYEVVVRNLRVGNDTRARFGANMHATRGFDPKWDAELPPSVGGFQAYFEGSVPLFEDVRRYGLREEFSLVLTGLRPGERYVITLVPIEGRHRVEVVDEDGRVRTINALSRWTLYPTTTEMRFQIRVGGAR